VNEQIHEPVPRIFHVWASPRPGVPRPCANVSPASLVHERSEHSIRLARLDSVAPALDLYPESARKLPALDQLTRELDERGLIIRFTVAHGGEGSPRGGHVLRFGSDCPGIVEDGECRVSEPSG
jgi:hypothetical protein